MGDLAFVAFAITLTVGVYALSRRAFLTYGSALLSPVFLSTLVIIALLSVFRIPFDRYKPAQEIMTVLLGPAVVALALPLYRQRHILVQRLPAVLAGVASGSLVSLGAVVAVARAAGLEKVIVVSLAPKSVTAPVAVEIARIIGGNQALTAAFVITTGVLGSMLGPWFLSWIRIHDPVARGLAVGTSSHGQGTAMMLRALDDPVARRALGVRRSGQSETCRRSREPVIILHPCLRPRPADSTRPGHELRIDRPRAGGAAERPYGGVGTAGVSGRHPLATRGQRAGEDQPAADRRGQAPACPPSAGRRAIQPRGEDRS